MMREVHDKLPPGWVKTTLGEVLEFKYGKSLPAKKRDDTGYPVYGSNGEVGHHSVPLTQGPTLIVGRKGSIGEVHLSNEKCWPIDTTYYIDNLYGQPAEFWLHLLRSLGLSELNRATTLPGLNRNDAYKFSLDIPPLNEQKRIVTRIEELQLRSRRAREALETVPDLLEQLRQSLLAAAFRGDLTKEWRKKNPDVEPASELLKRIRTERRKSWEEAELQKLEARGFTDEKLEAEFSKRRKQYKEPTPADTTDLSGLPASWCWAVAEELTPIDAPIIYGILQPGPNIADGIPYVRPTEISDDHIVLDRLRRTSSMIAGRYNRSQLKVNDILLSMVGTIGKVAIVPRALEGGNITQSSVRVRADSACALPEYLAWSLRSPFVREQFEKYRLGTAVPRLNVEDVRRLAFPLPPLGEQLRIANIINERLANLVNARRHVHNLLELITILEESVFRKAFQGELVSQDPNDEPALVLLERIREEKARREAEEKRNPKRRGVRIMERQEDKQRDVLAVLGEAHRPMTPEEVFEAGGFDEEAVDAFYEQLRSAIVAKLVREIRKGDSVMLEVVKT